jgi:UDP-N-acetylmuramoylalanine-D-glutamate ligase
MASLRYAPAILIGRAVRVAARLRKRGGGSAIPGLVVNRLAPGFLAASLNSFPDGLVIVSGSSGKSTTTKMLVAILRAHGLSVFTNPSTANITQGLTSALLEEVSLTGRLRQSIAVLEMDEGHGALVARDLHPQTVILTNVMTDQIDRFHDSEFVANLLGAIAVRATRAVVYNADDGLLAGLLEPLDVPTIGFGASPSARASSRRGLGYAVQVATREPAEVEVTAVSGRDATATLAGETLTLRLPARGIHYAVDAAAALAGAHTILGAAFDSRKAADVISALEPVFARGEVTTVAGEPVEFVLVQNPASFQLNVDELDRDLDQVLVAVGSDVRDPSYFWPVDLSDMPAVAIVTGSKAHEMALQLAYQGVTVGEIDTDLPAAIDRFLALPAPKHGIKTVIFTADSMRRTRTHLGLA